MSDSEVMDDSPDVVFYPPHVWGLDPQFNVYNKMYVRDVLQMPQYSTAPGAFAYKNHPIFKVDIIGVVVKVDRNSKCFIYAVDDGTGVVLCCCWKEGFHKYRPSELSGLPAVLLTKVSEIMDDNERMTDGYSLGDLIHIRGKVKVFREKKEVVANYHCRVSDPMVEVLRMSELRRLYPDCYDKPFHPSGKVRQALFGVQAGDGNTNTLDGTVFELKTALLGHFARTNLVEVTVADLLLMDKVKVIVKEGCDNEAEINERGLALVLQTMALLEGEGLVVTRGDRRRLYEILLHKSKLEEMIKQILKAEVLKPKYSELGCHYMHILDVLHNTVPYTKVKKPSVMYCFHKLESDSELISTTRSHYLPCDFG